MVEMLVVPYTDILIPVHILLVWKHCTVAAISKVTTKTFIVVACLIQSLWAGSTRLCHIYISHPHSASLSSTVGPLHVTGDQYSRAIGSSDVVVA